VIIVTVKFGITPRVQRLREKVRKVEHKKYREFKELSVLDDDTLRNKPLIVRKAHGFRLILEEMPIYIEKDELIVGGRTLLWKNPEKRSWGQFKQGAEHFIFFYARYATEEEKKQAEETTKNMLNRAMEGWSTAHSAAGFQRVLKQGFGGIKKMALERATETDDMEKINFYDAVVIIMDAIISFIQRYAQLAQEMSESESNQSRRSELKVIAANCRQIAANPPQSYWQALQLFYFTHLFAQIENMTMMSLGRFDQYIYPYYKNDIENGRVTKEQAQELLECLWIKFNDTADITTDNGMHVTLSGLTPDGEDGTNELSFMCIDATMHLRIVDPKINVRLHKNTPEDFLDKCCELAKIGMGYPAVFNDETIIPTLEKYGVSQEHARDYCTDGCSEVMIPGRSDFYPVQGAIMLLEPLQKTLSRLGGFADFEDLYKDFKFEVKSSIEKRFARVRIWEQALADISPVPYLSATLEGCLESGLDKTRGGALYNHTGAIASGFVNTVNSLVAIKEAVFKKKLVSQEGLKTALENNYEGYEELRQTLYNLPDKFGNDIEEVDRLAVELATFFSREVLKHNNSRGGRFLPGFFQYQYVIEGKRIGATPDGRKDGAPLANNLAPYIGTGHNGPTAVLKSATKLNPELCPLGISVDVKISGNSLKGEEGTVRLAAFFRSFVELGGMEFQLNTVSSETLRKAQANPEEYRDLVVRVWGFNAYFVTLTEEYQNYIIERTEHSL